MMKLTIAVVLLGIVFVQPTGATPRTMCVYCAYDLETGCFQMDDGLYQSCQDCFRYIRCENGVRVERNQCPGGWWFSPYTKSCVPPVNGCCGCYCTDPFTTPAPPAPTTTPTPVPTSTTTRPPVPTSTPTRPPVPTPTRPADQCTSTGPGCITASSSSCHGRPDGDYQACEGCTFYHSCVAGYLNYAFRPCPLTNQGGLHGYLVWQRKAANVFNEGTCEYTSNTCTECADNPIEPSVPDTCTNTGNGCITSSSASCNGLPDGDYQACEGCTFYHSCVAGYLNYAFRPCPLTNQGGLRGYLVWQRAANKFNEGTCEYSSTTCTECLDGNPNPPPISTPVPVLPTQAETCTSTGNGCITSSAESCRGLPDGDYQACEGCTYYHSCVAGYLNYAFRPCPKTNQGGLRGYLVWQRKAANVFNEGTCEYSSVTCTECQNNQPTNIPPTPPPTCSNTGSGCITSSAESCRGLPDGDYQACEGCTFYHSCVAGYLNYAFRPCPLTNIGGLRGRLVWQRKAANVYNEGTCEYTSNTCSECLGEPPVPVTPGTQEPPVQPCDGGTETTGTGCITSAPSSCHGKPDGDYQACEGCTYYHSCVAGYLNYAFRPCPKTHYGGLRGYLVWQRKAANVFNEGTCEYFSTTCRECGSEEPDQPGQCVSTGRDCITKDINSCQGLPDGDYQACEDCTTFYKCSNGYIYKFDCPLTDWGGLRGKLIWQQWTTNTGRCERESTSCKECDEVYPKPTTAAALPPTNTPVPTDAPTEPEDPDWTPCQSTGSSCLSAFPGACQGRADGHYQACEGCTIYHSCSGGVLYSSRLCARTNKDGLRGRLVWRQVTPTAGICDYTSNTCTECAAADPEPSVPPTCPAYPRCVHSWASCREDGLADGDYQICQSCFHYLSCRNGETWPCRPCPSYNDRPQQWKVTSPTQGYCTDSSDTCNQCPYLKGKSVKQRFVEEVRRLKLEMKRKSTGASCITGRVDSCRGLADGDYQACEGCTFYHSCAQGVTFANRNCPAGLVWQSTGVGEGRCDYSSSSCRESRMITKVEKVEEKSKAGWPCKSASSSCVGQADGDYQACESCSIYHTCAGGAMHANRNCPPGLVWDDWSKQCGWTSPTCP